MKNLKSRIVTTADLPFIKTQGYILRDHVLMITKNNCELNNKLKTIFKGSGITNLMAHVFYNRKSWAELKVNSHKTTIPNENTAFANDSKNIKDLHLYAFRLNEFINQQLGYEQDIVALAYVIDLMPQNNTRTPKTPEMKKFICKMKAGSPLKMIKPFSVTYLSNGTEQRGLVINLSDTFDCSEQLLCVATKNKRVLISLSDVIMEHHKKNAFDDFNLLDQTITGKEAINYYNNGQSIISYTVITDENIYDNCMLCSFTIKPNKNETLNDQLSVIANTHITNGFKFKLKQ